MIKEKKVLLLKKIFLSICASLLICACDNLDMDFENDAGAFFESYGNVATVSAVQYSRPLLKVGGALFVDSSADFTISYFIDNPGNFVLNASSYNGFNGTLKVQSTVLITVTYTAAQLATMEGNGSLCRTLSISAYTPLGLYPQSVYNGSVIKCDSAPPKIKNALGQMQSDPASSINERLVVALQLPALSISSVMDWKSLCVTDKRTGKVHEFAFNPTHTSTIPDGTVSNGWTATSYAPTGMGPTYTGGPTFSPMSGEGAVYYIVTDVDNMSSVKPFDIQLSVKDDNGLTNPITIPSHSIKLEPPTCSDYTGALTNTLGHAYAQFKILAPANASDATLHYTITDSSGNPVADTSGSATEHVGDATFRLYPKLDGSAETYTISQAYASKTGYVDSDDAAVTFGSGGTITVTGAQLSAPTCNLVDGQTYPQETELIVTSPEAADIGWTYTVGGGTPITGSASSPASITLEEAGSYAFDLYAQKEYYEKSATVNLSCSVALTALYVASYGLDTNAGTKAYPFGTIQHAIDTFAAGATPASPANTIYILTDMTSINGLTSLGSGYVNIVGCKGGATGVPGTPVALACAHDVTVIQLSGGTMSLRAISITGIDGTSNGAVNVATGGTLILKDKVTITGNKKSDGSAMNVNIGSGVITVDANGISGTKVGVTSASAPSLGSPVEITSGYGASVSATDNPALHFASDNASYGIGLNAAGTEAALITGGGSIGVDDIASVTFAATGSAGVYTVTATATPTSGSAVDITSEVTAWTLKLYYLNTYTGESATTNTMDLSTLGAGTYILKVSAVYGGKTYSGEVEIAISEPMPADFKKITAGNFTHKATSTATTAYTVTLTKDFYMCEHEVTQKEWFDVMGVKQEDMCADDKGRGDNYPVYYVNWYAAIAYCNKRSVKEGLTPCYTVSGVTDWGALDFASIPTSSDSTWNAATCSWTATGYRLPTEAEWEYAALGAYKDNPNWNGYGNSSNSSASVFAGYNGSNSIDNYAWYSGNASVKTHEAKKKTENSNGLYDMSGNVWEWCWDWHGSYDSANVTDPIGASGSMRVFRGGSWRFDADNCSVALRYSGDPHYRHNDLGFRVVRNAP